MANESRHLEEKDSLLANPSMNSTRAGNERTISVMSKYDRNYKWPAIHLLLIGLYTALFIFTIRNVEANNDDGVIEGTYSPAAGQITYYTKEPLLDHSVQSPFYGEPRLEMDEAWYEVFKGTIITVSADELQKANITSFKLAGSNEYGASLGVYHDLHCLKRIKQWMYPEYYYKEIPPKQKAEVYEHLLHCFEVLRESLMCRPDISLLGYDSSYMSSRGTPRTVTSRQRCTDWDALHAWSLDRAPADPLNAYLNSESRPENGAQHVA